MIIIGIDPGYDRVGIAVVEKGVRKDRVHMSQCLLTDKALPFYERLLHIGEQVGVIIATYPADAMAVEQIFFNKNQKTAFRVAEARAVIIYQGLLAKMPVHEYTPLQIKIALTGYGNSPKQQVAHMVHELTDLPPHVRYDDEYDAVAVAVTALASLRSEEKNSTIKNKGGSRTPGLAKAM